MKLTRRNFLAWAGLSAVGAVACDVFQEGELSVQSPRDLPEDLVKGRDNWYATLSDAASGGEGVIVRVMEGRAKKIRGNPKYPVNQGKQGPRAEGGLQALYHPDRIAGPLRRTGSRGSGQFKAIDWEPEALEILRREVSARRAGMALITEPLRGTLGRIAGQFVASLGGQNGKHLGFAALDRKTEKDAVKKVFDQDLLPDFDLAQANYVLSFGADFLSTWGASTRLATAYGDFRQGPGRESRGTLVQVDPRFSLTAANADKWLPIKPGTEGHLALSIAQVILSEGLAAPGVDVAALTNGQGAAALADFAPERVAGMLELPPELLKGQSAADYIRELARDFAGHRPAIALGGDSAGAHTNGSFNLQAVYALNYLVGSVGQPGGIRFNPRSPIRELPDSAVVGSLADWKSVRDGIRGGDTRLVMVHNANPVYGLPQSAGFADALNREDLFIVSFSSFMDETTIMADLILPDRVYLEGWGDDLPEPGPGYQVIGMQQPVVNPLSDLNPRSFGDILLSVAQELGQENALPWNGVEAALRENAAALYELNRGTSRQADSPEALWQLMLRQGGWWDETRQGVAPEPPRGLLNDIAGIDQGERTAKLMGDGDFHLLPFAHNSLGDGGNAHLPWMQALPDPVTTITWQTWAEVNSKQAAALGWREGDVVRIESAAGSVTALLYPNPAMPPNVVAVPLGQGRRAGSDYATGGDVRESSNVMDLFQISPAPEPKPEQTGETETEKEEPPPPEETEAGGLAWAGVRVRVSPTGESLKVAKFEGAFPAREIALGEGEEIIKVTTGGAH